MNSGTQQRMSGRGCLSCGRGTGRTQLVRNVEKDSSVYPDTYIDPADYMFENAKFHDCFLTVGNPEDDVQLVGVCKIYLISQSSVFRDIIDQSQLADPSGQRIHIEDVTPSVFRLMLRYVYGGQMPKLSRETAVQLIFCADKYNILPLVKWTCNWLIPRNTEELFPALFCVTYISLPYLLPHVTRLLQGRTKEVLEFKEFLDLDENCVEFIVKQESLDVSELQLWQYLVKWADNKAEGLSDRRQLLHKPLKHLRILTLTETNIIQHVLKTNIFNQAEIINILSAILNKEALTVPDLCKIRQTRSSFIFRELVQEIGRVFGGMGRIEV